MQVSLIPLTNTKLPNQTKLRKSIFSVLTIYKKNKCTREKKKIAQHCPLICDN